MPAGGRIVFNDIPKLRAALRPRASQIIRKAAFDIEAGAKTTVPVDTGNLKNSIQTHMDGDIQATVAAHAEYAIYVEMGTYRMAARPYLVPALEAVRPSAEAAMRELFTL